MPRPNKMNGQKEVILAFLPLDSDLLEKSVLNWAAAKIAPKRKYKVSSSVKQNPMVHVECWLRDDNDKSSGYAASICYNREAHYHRKKFSRTSWHFRSIFVTNAQFKKLKLLFSHYRGSPFNRVGFFALACGLRIKGSWRTKFGFKRSFFCAELVVHCLKEVGYFQKGATNEIPEVCHPEELFQWVSLTSSTVTTIREYEQNKVQY